MRSLSIILCFALMFVATGAKASNYCYSCYNNVVQQQALVTYPQVNVAFVPTQVNLGGQITVYDPNAAAASGLGYSYQGPVATAPGAATTDANVQLQIIDSKLDILIKALGASSETTSPPAEDPNAVDPNPVQPNGSAHPGAAAVQGHVDTAGVSLPPLEVKVAGEQRTTVEEAFTEPNVEVAAVAKGWKDVLSAKCAKCHSAGAESGFELMNADGSFKDKLPRYEIYSHLILDEKDPEFMPKGGKRLEESDLELIRAWVHKGLEGLNY